MPFEIMDQRGVSASSYFHEEVFCAAEGQIEILKPNAVFDLQGSGVKVPSSNELVLPEDQLEKLGSVGEGFSMNSWMPVDSQQKAWSSFCVQPASHGLNGKTDASDIGCESSLFSSSLSELFSRKMRFMRNDVRSPQPANNVAFDNEEAELFESIEDIEAQTIGNLLPDENDLFSGVIDEVGQNSRGSSGDDIEDFDLFSSGGGMELEGDGMRNGQKGSNLFGQLDSARAKKLDSARAKTIGVQEPSHPIDGMGSGNNGISNLHPHSFPEYHDGFVLGSPYRIPGTFVEMVGNDMKMNGGFNTKTEAEAPPNGHHMGVHAGAFGSPRNGSIINGNHQMYPQQQPFPNPMIWPHSSSSINGVHAHRFPPVVAFPRASTMILKAPSPVHHHIGSAPTVKPAFWDRRHAFIAESPDSSGFCLGSPSHPLDIAQHNIFAQVGGTRMDMSVNVGPRSPHFFGGRNSLMSMPASFDSPNERVRNFSHRRSDTVSNNADKKLYELDIDRILRGEDSRTTLMIKNIPNKYTSKMLLAAIDEYCKGTYDFIYLPIDFKNKCNVGYAFINMIDPDKIIPFHKALNGKKWEKFNSEKVASIAYARIQGKTALIAHFQNSSLMNEDKRCRPILFHTNGPNAGDQEPFPMGANIRARTGNPRAVNNGRNYGQGSSFSLPANKDETSNGADFSSKVL